MKIGYIDRHYKKFKKGENSLINIKKAIDIYF